MPTNTQFLEAIAAEPDADLPRLIYADWLEEQGDLRGEFIRVQCELATLPRGTDRHSHLSDRGNELLKAHIGEWLPPRHSEWIKYEFHHGLPDQVRYISTIDRIDDKQLFDSTFPVHSLALELAGSEHKYVTRAIVMREFDHLDVLLKDLASHGKEMVGLELLRCPARLINSTASTRDLVERVCTLIPPYIREFSFIDNTALMGPDTDNAARIARALPRELKKLRFSGNNLGGGRNGAQNLPEFVGALPPALESLDLSYNYIGENERGVQDIGVLAANLPQTLKHLDLSHNDFSNNEKVATLVNHLPAGLESLDLSESNLWYTDGSSYEAVWALADAPLVRLVSLSASSSRPTVTEMETWRRRLIKNYEQTIRSNGEIPSLVSLEVLHGEELDKDLADLRDKAAKLYFDKHPEERPQPKKTVINWNPRSKTALASKAGEKETPDSNVMANAWQNANEKSRSRKNG